MSHLHIPSLFSFSMRTSMYALRDENLSTAGSKTQGAQGSLSSVDVEPSVGQSLSIVIPCYNEGENILATLKEIRGYFKDKEIDFEVIVVNDGSKDNTKQQLEQSADAALYDQLVSYDQNRGKGYAVQQGVFCAKKQYVLFMDADHTIDIAHLDLMGNQPIVIGSKYIAKSNYSLFRSLLGKSFSAIRKAIVGLEIQDTQCGFKRFDTDIAQSLFTQLKTHGWCFDVEILLRAKQVGVPIKEIPVQVKATDSVSKLHFVRDSFKMLRELMKIRKIMQHEKS